MMKPQTACVRDGGYRAHPLVNQFRVDAAFAKPEIYEKSEERGVKYAIRIPANDSLERDIAELLTRPVGPSHGGWWPSSSSTAGSYSRAWD